MKTFIKSVAVVLVAIIFVSPLTTPITVDAQARSAASPTRVAAPTASITIGGAQAHTAKTGEGIPAVIWRSAGGNAFKTTLMVNSPAQCNGITDNQRWGQGGNTANGSTKLPDAGKAREGCVLTFVFEVTNAAGQRAVDRATLRYVAASSVGPVAAPVVKPPVTNNTNNGTTSTSTPPIPGQTLKLLTPNGGEKWMLNSDSTIITWSPNPHASNMVAHLEKKSGSNFITIGKMVEMKKGSIHWSGEIIPTGESTARYADPGSGYYVRIWNTKTGETDRSDAPFEIVAVDAFDVSFHGGDTDGTIAISEATNVRASWDVTAGVENVSCTLVTFDQYGVQQSSANVKGSGFQDIWAPLPSPDYNGGLYTLAHIYCTSPLGARVDYLNVVTEKNTNARPFISIGRDNYRPVPPGDEITFHYSGENLNVPNDIRVLLSSEAEGIVAEMNIGDTGTTSPDVFATTRIPADATPGRYRMGICDENTANPDTPFKPLCSWDTYFVVIYGNEEAIHIDPLTESATVDQAEFTGDIEKGIFEIELLVSTNVDIYIRDTVKKALPASDDRSAGFVFEITDNGTRFMGTSTAYIAETSASMQNTKNDGAYYKVPAGDTESFTVRVELDPVGASSGQAYGMALEALQYRRDLTTSGMEKILLSQFATAGFDFQTNKVTIDSTGEAAQSCGSFTRDLTLGSRGADVARLQNYLVIKGAPIFPNSETAYFGARTKAALAAHQASVGISPADGFFGPRTRAYVSAQSCTSGQKGSLEKIEGNIAQGAVGAKVSLVQAALKKAGLFNENITGYFGSITKAAIAAFQRENALDNIGAVGPKTAELLNQVLSQ